jgi:Zn-dependent peptidase ImmA (M78 family)
MMSNDLYLKGARKALEARQALKASPQQVVPIIDNIGFFGAQVWFRDAATYDGTYSPGGLNLIVLSSLRPLGRINYTAAHELGHHLFGHGEVIEEVREGTTDGFHYGSNQNNELLANAFAANFLMPRALIDDQLKMRGIENRKVTPLDLLAISSALGVGYSTLAYHMCYILRSYSRNKLDELLRDNPRKIKQTVLGKNIGGDLIYIDQHWNRPTADCRIGDMLCFPPGSVAPGAQLTKVPGGGSIDIYEARQTGEVIVAGNKPTTVRVGKRGFTGRSLFIYDEEA